VLETAAREAAVANFKETALANGILSRRASMPKANCAAC